MDADRFLRTIGAKIRATRKAKGTSQERLAELAGLHPTYISNIENGKVNASISSYFAVAKALGIPLSDLVSLPAGKADQEVEDALTGLLGDFRGLGRKKQAVFLSAAEGLLGGLETKKTKKSKK